MQLAKYIYCGDQEGLALDLQYSHYVMENGQRGVYFTVNILICLFPGLPYFQFKAPPIVSHPLCFCLHQYSASHKTHVQGTTLSTFDPPNKWPTYWPLFFVLRAGKYTECMHRQRKDQEVILLFCLLCFDQMNNWQEGFLYVLIMGEFICSPTSN